MTDLDERTEIILDLLTIIPWTDLIDCVLPEELEDYYMEEIQSVAGG